MSKFRIRGRIKEEDADCDDDAVVADKENGIESSEIMEAEAGAPFGADG